MKLILLSLIGIAAWGQQSLNLRSGAPPSASLSISGVGNPGNGMYCYWLNTRYAIGSSLSNAACVTNGPNTLNASTYIKVNWNAMPGATGYDVIRLTNIGLPGPGSCNNCVVLANSTLTTFNDQGGTVTNYSQAYAPGATAIFSLDNRDDVAPFVNLQINANRYRLVPFSGNITPGNYVKQGAGGLFIDGGGGTGGGGTFDALGSGVNTTFTGTVGTGGTLNYSGLGIVDASYLSHVQLTTLTGLTFLNAGVPRVATSTDIIANIAANAIANNLLANSSITVNSQTCVLGGTCAITLGYQMLGANGVTQTQRNRLNLIPGTNVTIIQADNPGTNSTDVTISSTGGGGGGGASASTQLTDFVPTRTSNTRLTIAGCTVALPCNVRTGNTVTSITAGPITVDNAGSGADTLYLYMTAAGTLAMGSTTALTVSAGGSSVIGISGFPVNSFPLYKWAYSAGSWASVGTDERGWLSSDPQVCDLGCTLTTAAGISHIVVPANSVIGVCNVLSGGAVITVDLSSCNGGAAGTDIVFGTIQGAITSLSLLNAIPGQRYSLKFTEDTNGSWIVTLPGLGLTGNCPVSLAANSTTQMSGVYRAASATIEIDACTYGTAVIPGPITDAGSFPVSDVVNAAGVGTAETAFATNFTLRSGYLQAGHHVRLHATFKLIAGSTAPTNILRVRWGGAALTGAVVYASDAVVQPASSTVFATLVLECGVVSPTSLICSPAGVFSVAGPGGKNTTAQPVTVTVPAAGPTITYTWQYGAGAVGTDTTTLIDQWAEVL